MPQCKVTIWSISIDENGDAASAEWRLNIFVNGQHQGWSRDGVTDGQVYPLNYEFTVDIDDCDDPIRLEVNGYEEDGFLFDDHDPIAPITANLNPKSNAPAHLTGSNKDVSYSLNIQVDCPSCRIPQLPPQVVTTDEGTFIFDPNTGTLIPIPPPTPTDGLRSRELSATVPPIETRVVGRVDFLEQVRSDFLKRLSERRAKDIYQVPDQPTESDLLRVGLMRVTKSGWELMALSGEELIFRLTPYGRSRLEYLRMVDLSLPKKS